MTCSQGRTDEADAIHSGWRAAPPAIHDQWKKGIRTKNGGCLKVRLSDTCGDDVTRPELLRSIHPLSWLAKAADLELAAGRLRLLRAAARRLLVVDHSLLGKHAVVSGLGLDMGHGRWSRWFVVVG